MLNRNDGYFELSVSFARVAARASLRVQGMTEHEVGFD